MNSSNPNSKNLTMGVDFMTSEGSGAIKDGVTPKDGEIQNYRPSRERITQKSIELLRSL